MTAATRWGRSLIIAASASATCLNVACEREQRRYQEMPPAAATASDVRVSALQPGGQTNPSGGAPKSSPYVEDAWAVAEGKRLFESFNCSGCHAHGGGGIGPPLMDHRWIYGSDPENIHASIVQGRPNGMPSFRGRITEQQAWQLAAYVRSLSGLLATDVSPGRTDHMWVKPSEQSTPRQAPVWTGALP